MTVCDSVISHTTASIILPINWPEAATSYQQLLQFGILFLFLEHDSLGGFALLFFFDISTLKKTFYIHSTTFCAFILDTQPALHSLFPKPPETLSEICTPLSALCFHGPSWVQILHLLSHSYSSVYAQIYTN